MHNIEDKPARVIAFIYHGGPAAFRQVQEILRDAKQAPPEALEDVWRHCENIVNVDGIQWKDSMLEELFGYSGEDAREEDTAELEASHVSREEIGLLLLEMLDEEWRNRVESIQRDIGLDAHHGEDDKLEKDFAAWQAERAKGPPSSRHRTALRKVIPPWIANPGLWERDEKGIMRRLPMLSHEARIVKEPPREVIIPGVLEVGRVTGFVGKAEAGKSLHAVGMGHSVATGTAWYGLQVKRSGPVLILDNEMPENSIFGAEGRLDHLLPPDFKGPLCVHPMFDEMAWQPEARIRPEVNMDKSGKSRYYTLERFEEYLEWVLARLDFPEPPVALILDGAAQFYNGVLNEIASDEPRSFVDAFRALGLRHALAVAMVLHTAKNPGEADTAIRGGQGWGDTLDHVVVASKKDERLDPATGKLTDITGTIEWGKARYGDKGQVIHLRRQGLALWQVDPEGTKAAQESNTTSSHRKGTPRDYSPAKVRKAVPPGETVDRTTLSKLLNVAYNTAKNWGDAAVADGVLEKVGRCYRGLPEAV